MITKCFLVREIEGVGDRDREVEGVGDMERRGRGDTGYGVKRSR
jgi:hypothetical protein